MMPFYLFPLKASLPGIRMEYSFLDAKTDSNRSPLEPHAGHFACSSTLLTDRITSNSFLHFGQ